MPDSQGQHQQQEITLIVCTLNRRRSFHFYGLPLKNTYLQSNHEKNIKQIPNVGHSMKYPASCAKNSPGYQKQGKSETLSKPQGD